MRDIRKKELSEIARLEVYFVQEAHKLTKSNGIKDIAGGVEFLAYVRTFGCGPSGYEGMLYAQTIGDRMFSRKVRIISNHGLEIRDF